MLLNKVSLNITHTHIAQGKTTQDDISWAEITQDMVTLNIKLCKNIYQGHILRVKLPRIQLTR